MCADPWVHHQLISGSLCASSPPPRRRGGRQADPFVHPRIQRCILTQNLWSMFTKTKFPRKLGTVLIWNFYEIFLRPLGTALSYFFPSKLLILVNLGWFLLGARHEFIFWDARKDPQMHERIRRCTKGSAWRTPLTKLVGQMLLGGNVYPPHNLSFFWFSAMA